MRERTARAVCFSMVLLTDTHTAVHTHTHTALLQGRREREGQREGGETEGGESGVMSEIGKGRERGGECFEFVRQ